MAMLAPLSERVLNKLAFTERDTHETMRRVAAFSCAPTMILKVAAVIGWPFQTADLLEPYPSAELPRQSRAVPSADAVPPDFAKDLEALVVAGALRKVARQSKDSGDEMFPSCELATPACKRALLDLLLDGQRRRLEDRMEAARSNIEDRRASIKEVWGASRSLEETGRQAAKPAGPKRRWSSAEKKTHAAGVFGWGKSGWLGKSGRLGPAPAAAQAAAAGGAAAVSAGGAVAGGPAGGRGTRGGTPRRAAGAPVGPGTGAAAGAAVAARVVAAEGSEPTGEERARTASLKEEKHGYDAQLKALGERPHESTGHALA